MGTNDKLVPGELLMRPELRYRENRFFTFNKKSKLTLKNKNINEEIAHV